MSTPAGAAMPQGRPAARSDAPAGRVSEDIARAEARAEHKPPTLPVEVPAFRIGRTLTTDRREAAIATVMRVLGGHTTETQRIATLFVDLRHDLRPAIDWLDQAEAPTRALKVVKR